MSWRSAGRTIKIRAKKSILCIGVDDSTQTENFTLMCPNQRLEERGRERKKKRERERDKEIDRKKERERERERKREGDKR